MAHSTLFLVACVLAGPVLAGPILAGPILAGHVVAQGEPASEQASGPSQRGAESRREKKREGGFFGLGCVETRVEVERDDGPVTLPAILLRSVVQESDAARLGFRKGDRITAINGIRMRNGDVFLRALYQTLRGKKNTITLWRPRGTAFAKVEIDAGLRELDVHPKVGDPAPDFGLADGGGKKNVRLGALLAKGKPVFLVFGSYT